jgi:hypothetical protein
MVIIDFEQAKELIPVGGSLHLILTRKTINDKEEITVCFAPKYPGKEDLKELRPLTLKGTAADLNNDWASHVLGIAELASELAASTVVDARKTEIAKAVLKNTTKKTETKPDAKASSKAEAKTTAEKPQNQSLFAESGQEDAGKQSGGGSEESTEETLVEDSEETEETQEALV